MSSPKEGSPFEVRMINDTTSNTSSCDDTGSPNWVPSVGMKFVSVEKAWQFWKDYGGKMGFNVRKHYENKNKDGIVSSRRFLCAKEGFRKMDKRDSSVTNPRAETRTGCKVRIGFTLDKEKGIYVVHDFESEHNHLLHPPETVHLLSSQRKMSAIQALEIELADKSGIKPRVAHELNGAHVGGSSNLSYTHLDHKNYLRTKRQRDMRYGEAASLLKYFHSQTIENPSFQYSIQLDSEEQITNIFWADAKMLIDYSLFGDGVAFDTTFGTNKENRPLGVFVGFNHFRELVVFGVTLLYDETAESFKWLFETFLPTHDNKRPKTIFTDQDIAMRKAIVEVMPDTWHGLCTWHIMQNATKHLIHDGSNVLKDFKACMYDYEEEAVFEEAFNALRGKVQKSSWLDSIYALKEKWAGCYMSNVFSLGMRSTQLSESFNKDLKDYLQCNLDIMRFFNHFERVLKQKRDNEVHSEFQSREKLPKLKLQRTPLLRQVGQVYTPKVFEAFQDEYEWSTAAYIKPRLEGQHVDEYRVGISDLGNDKNNDMERRVFGDPCTETVACSCKMFERVGILCSHALKVLDTMNIKLIPQKYILKRWTREARNGIVQHSSGRTIVEDPHLDATCRYKALCRKFIKIASEAATFKESSSLLEKAVDDATVNIEKLLSSMNFEKGGQASTLPSDNATAQLICAQPLNLNTVTLKKKVQKRPGRRKRSWTEKLHKASSSDQMKENPQKKNKKNHHNIENEAPDGQCNISKEVYAANFSKQAYTPSQDVNLQLSSHIVFKDLSNGNWLGL